MWLSAERIISKPSVFAQELFENRVVIKNLGKELGNLCLSDTSFQSMTIPDGRVPSTLSLPGGGITELYYVSKAARGVYSWSTIHAIVSDPLGLVEIQRDIPAFGKILVRPAPAPIHSMPLKPRSTLHAVGPISARLAGSGTDFLGIREYRAGDSLRRLNTGDWLPDTIVSYSQMNTNGRKLRILA